MDLEIFSGIFSGINANCLQSVPVKEFWKIG